MKRNIKHQSSFRENKMNYEIISPEIKSTFNPKGKEVLLLLSGKMIINLSKDKIINISKDKPIVIDRPYSLSCPNGPGTGRALRITIS